MNITRSTIQYQCPKCGFTAVYGEGLRNAPEMYTIDGKPLCFKCMVEFLSKSIPKMELIDD